MLLRERGPAGLWPLGPCEHGLLLGQEGQGRAPQDPAPHRDLTPLQLLACARTAGALRMKIPILVFFLQFWGNGQKPGSEGKYQGLVIV